MIGLLGRFRVLILLAVIGALGITAVAFIGFTDREVTRSTLDQGNAEARNLMRVIMLYLDDRHTDLEFFQTYARSRYEQQLRNLTALVVSQVDFYRELHKRGALTEEQARRASLDSVQNMRYGNNDYFFIYDRRNVAISHADPRFRGRDMSSATDMRGTHTAKAMWDRVKKSRDGFLTIWWTRLGEKEPVPKLLYFYHYDQWDWLIGTGLYIDDIDRDVDRKMADIMDSLKTTFGRIRVSETGYFNIFDGRGRVLVHPFLADTDGSGLKDPLTGRNHLQNLMAAARNPDQPFRYLWDKPDEPGNYRYWKYAHVQRFAPFDWYVSSSVYQDEMEKPARSIVQRQVLFVCLLLLFAIAGVYLLVSRMTGPLAKLAGHAARLQKNNFSLSPEGKRELAAIRFPSEIGHLSRTFGDMEERLAEYLQNIEETTAAREKMESELRIARDIQMSMLPHPNAVLAGRPEIELAAALEPAREVGGDLYDYFFIDNDRFCFMVGDVSDKGVPAALFMARSKAILRSCALEERGDPGRILLRANGELTDGNEMLMFITVFLGILNVRTGELLFSNAAHVPPCLFDETGPCRIVELPAGKPLGVTRRGSFRTERLEMQPGESLLVFTDGITEAENLEQDFFGDEGLSDLISTMNRSGGAKACVAEVLRAVNRFSGGAPRSDDMTLLCLRYLGAPETKQAFTASLTNALEEVDGALDAVDGFTGAWGCPQEKAFDLRVALEEILVNIVNHGKAEGTIEILLSITADAGGFHVLVSDTGRPFNPLEAEAVDLKKQKAERKIGGLGLHLVRNLADELAYQRQDGRNILQFAIKGDR